MTDRTTLAMSMLTQGLAAMFSDQGRATTRSYPAEPG